MPSFLRLTLLQALIIIVTKARICPDETSECADTSTCCLLAKGIYGCCPLEDAVCCDDYSHCCPRGTTCDTYSGRCLKGHGISLKMKRKQEARRVVNDEVICPDKRSKCPSGTTCCDLGQGRSGCCPLKDAVCCTDHLHCCPHSTICDVKHGLCIDEETDTVTPWLSKFKATKIVRKTSVRNERTTTKCLDGKQCVASGTCCESDEDYSSTCCPFRNGVCCGQGEHCCPQGYQCDAEEGRCTRDDELTSITLAWSATAQTSFEEDSDSEMCHDGSICPPRNKCCPTTSEKGYIQYGCCPLSEGVCCGQSCCPSGYLCAEGDKCEKRAIAEEFLDLFA